MSPPKVFTVVNNTAGFSEISKATRTFTAGVLNLTSGVLEHDKPGVLLHFSPLKSKYLFILVAAP